MQWAQWVALCYAMGSTADADAGLLDVKLLRLLDLLHATRSVTRTAEQLGQSQPTVSIWLGRLRRELRDPLFVRTPEGMQPTPRAEALLPTVRAALDALRLLSAPEQAFDPANTERRFRICMTDASHVTLLPRLLGRLRAAAPGLRLQAAQIDADTGRLLQSGDADLALGYVPELEAGFYQQALYAQDWVCLANPGHPRIRQGLDLRQYGQEGHVGIPSGTGHRLGGPARCPGGGAGPPAARGGAGRGAGRAPGHAGTAGVPGAGGGRVRDGPGRHRAAAHRPSPGGRGRGQPVPLPGAGPLLHGEAALACPPAP